MNESRDRNRVTPEGRALGAQMARMTAPIIAELASKGHPDQRCKSCAFREGTVPNGCPQTQLDALKAVVEGVQFDCHQPDSLNGFCFGWFAARASVARKEQERGRRLNVQCPWEFSPPDDAVSPVKDLSASASPATKEQQ